MLRLSSLPLALLCLPLLTACRPAPAATPHAGGGALERSVVVDAPADAAEVARTPVESSPSPSPSPSRLDPPPATPVPMNNDAFATERAGTATAQAPTPAAIGEVVELAPDVCGALTFSDGDGAPDCAAEVLRAGRLESREFAGLLIFDLRELPAGAELLYAALELTGLDNAFAGPEASWLLRAVELPKVWAAEQARFASLMSLAPSEPALAWRVTAADFPLGRKARLDVDEAGLALLSERLGRGRLALRIESNDNPARGDLALYGWHAAGESAPRLRVAWLGPGLRP